MMDPAIKLTGSRQTSRGKLLVDLANNVFKERQVEQFDPGKREVENQPNKVRKSGRKRTACKRLFDFEFRPTVTSTPKAHKQV